MKLRIENLTILFLMSVVGLVGCNGCGLVTDLQTAQQTDITLNGQQNPDQKDATADAGALKVKIGRTPSGRSAVLESLDSQRGLTDGIEVVEASVNTEESSTLSREFLDHVNTVHNDGNNYFSNPNFWQEKYDLIDEYLGLDTEKTVRFIIEHNLYTEAIVKYLDDYDAFRYIEENAPYGEKGKAVKFAERIFASEPESLKGLEAGLYLARMTEDIGGDITEGHTAYLAVLRHHPESVDALYGLGNLLYNSDAPENAIYWYQNANRLVPSHFNYELGSVYDLLGDYKTAWVYFRKELNARKHPEGSTIRHSTRKSLYIYEIEQDPAPPISTSPVDLLSMSTAELTAFVNWEKSLSTKTPIDINLYLAQEIRAHIRGEVSPFEITQLVRAFEHIHRHGKEEGIKRIEQDDPKLANKVKQSVK